MQILDSTHVSPDSSIISSLQREKHAIEGIIVDNDLKWNDTKYAEALLSRVNRQLTALLPNLWNHATP